MLLSHSACNLQHSLELQTNISHRVDIDRIGIDIQQDQKVLALT